MTQRREPPYCPWSGIGHVFEQVTELTFKGARERSAFHAWTEEMGSIADADGSPGDVRKANVGWIPALPVIPVAVFASALHVTP